MKSENDAGGGEDYAARGRAIVAKMKARRETPEGARDAIERELFEQAQRRDDQEKDLATQGIPRRVWPYILGDKTPMETPALAAVRQFVEKKEEYLLVLAGPVGTGKTVAAAVATPRPMVFVRAAALARMDWYDQAAIDALQDAHHLVIDDLGTEYLDAKGFLAAMVGDLLNVRYDEQRLTIMTTNATVEEWVDRYGERTEDRLIEAGKLFEIKGESMRTSEKT